MRLSETYSLTTMNALEQYAAQAPPEIQPRFLDLQNRVNQARVNVRELVLSHEDALNLYVALDLLRSHADEDSVKKIQVIQRIIFSFNAPTTYKLQNGCHNCRFVFKKEDFEAETELFCTVGATIPRPHSMSVSMNEFGPSPYDPEVESRMQDEWDKWSAGREVCSHGICDLWEQGE